MAFELTAAPILCVTSVPEAIAFYERCFGFARPDYFSGNEDYVVMKLGHAEVHLCESSRAHLNNVNAQHVACDEACLRRREKQRSRSNVLNAPAAPDGQLRSQDPRKCRIPGVVDQYVDPIEACHDRVHRCRYLFALAHVGPLS